MEQLGLMRISRGIADARWLRAALLVAVLAACRDKTAANRTDHKQNENAALDGSASRGVAGPRGHSDSLDRLPAFIAENLPQPYVACPAGEEDIDRILDEADASYGRREFHAVLSCASVATDLAPNSVEAFHWKAASLAALGRNQEAQLAFATALALDPDDPQTLAAVADFYINTRTADKHSSLRLGLQYAKSGEERAESRYRSDRHLRARLALLQAEALNDLGAAAAGLPLAEKALAIEPGLKEAIHERGVSLFNLCRFAEAKDAFGKILLTTPEDDYANHYFALAAEFLGDVATAESYYAKARAISPTEFSVPVVMPAAEFEAEVKKAIANLSRQDASALVHAELKLVDLPDMEDLMASVPPFSPTIMGLFRGTPLPSSTDEMDRESRFHDVVFTDNEKPIIFLYRKNLIRAVHSREELVSQIARTLVHEIGHLRGLDDQDLERRGLE